MAGCGGSGESEGENHVVAFACLYSTASLRQLPLKDRDRVYLVRDKPTGDTFHFSHAVHGNVHTLDKTFGEVLAQLLDQGHLGYLETSETACVEVRGTPASRSVDKVRVYFWLMLGIKRESVELVSRRFFRCAGVRLYLNIRRGGLNGEGNVYPRLFNKWKKTSKQFLMESANAATGVGLTPPSHVIKLELYQHQKQGLKWMVDREEWPDHPDNDELPPFWEEKDGVYRAELSSFITLERPQTIRGGILADESGMGKTLTLLSLIAYTKKQNTASGHQYMIRCDGEASRARKKLKVDHNLPVLEEEDLNFDWRPTLVVCPPPMLATWKGQIEKSTCAGSLKVCIYCGKSKTKDPNVLQRHDLVLTTYNILTKEEGSGFGVLTQIDWWRVVLDDAHVLKSSKSLATFSPFINLKAKRRWAVTGKQDYRNYDMYPIFSFLQIQPFCDDWPSIVDFPTIGPSMLWSRLEVLMGIFSLRRTMPERIIENHLVVLSKDEQDLYNSMESEARKAIISGPRSLQAAVLHLWQSCNSLALCRLSCADMVSSPSFQDLNREPDLLEKWVTVLQEEKDYACPVCLDQPEDIVITRCTHLFCRSCIMRLLEKHEGRKPFCPLCRSLLTKNDIFSAQNGPSVMEKMKYLKEQRWSSSANMSSKVWAMLNLILKSRTEDPNRKSVVLSQFQRMLILMAGVLSEAGFDVRCMSVIDNAKTKYKMVEEFIDSERPVVLLTTFKALGSSVLDLSAASNIYMMEPCWNVHTEEEALGRIHRLGKNDGINIV